MLREKYADYPPLLTTSEAGEIMRQSAYTVREQVRKGKLPSVRSGARILIPKDQLFDLIESQICEVA